MSTRRSSPILTERAWPRLERIDIEARILGRDRVIDPRHQPPVTTAILDAATAAVGLVSACGHAVGGDGHRAVVTSGGRSMVIGRGG